MIDAFLYAFSRSSWISAFFLSLQYYSNMKRSWVSIEVFRTVSDLFVLFIDFHGYSFSSGRQKHGTRVTQYSDPSATVTPAGGMECHILGLI